MAKATKKEAETVKSELVVTKISPKGINAVIKNVVLNWVFLAKPAQDNKDPLKASYRTAMILRGGEKEFVKAMETHLTTFLNSAAVKWGGDVRAKILKTTMTLDIDKSLFKTDQSGLGITTQSHQTVKRLNAESEFPLPKIPVKICLADGSECNPAMITQEFYSGVIADVAVFITAYDNDGRGITMYLNAVRKVANGERIAGIDPFAEVPVTSLLESGVGAKGLLI